jgi:predicted nucleic acid-binding protein
MTQRLLTADKLDAFAHEANLTRFLSAARVEVLFRMQGTPIRTNDLWAGALAVQHGLHLFARDRHFDHLPQIPRV